MSSEISKRILDGDSRIIVCIPAFNESANIGAIVKTAKLYATEVIVCDDGSSDLTFQEAKAAGATVVRHPFNRGYGTAIKTLFIAAKEKNADVMVTLESDGQHDPNQIPNVVAPILDEGYDIVVGSRFLKEEDRRRAPSYRSFGIKTITKLAQMTSQNNLTDAQSGFRAYSRNAISKIDMIEGGMAVSTEILMRAGQNNLAVKEVPITVRYDIEDASTHNPILQGLGILVSMIRYVSIYHPLAFYGLPGIVIMLVSAFYAVSALDLYSASRYVSTPMVIISVGSAVIGVVLIVTGVILYTMSALLRERIRTNHP